MSKLIRQPSYGLLLKNIAGILAQARSLAVRRINQILVKTYWEIGRKIVEYEQEGKERAEYGSDFLMKRLSKELSEQFGKGFSRTNLQNMRQLYLVHPKCQTLSAENN